MACSPCLSHPFCMETYILFILCIITGCHAATSNEDMAGIIAGSIFACFLFVGAIVGIIFWLRKHQKSKRLRKQEVIKASNNLDHSTIIVRRLPSQPGGLHFSTMHPEHIVGYQPSARRSLYEKGPVMNPMATISYLPMNRTAIAQSLYLPSQPWKSSRGRVVEELERKRKSRSHSRVLMSSNSEQKISNIELNSLGNFTNWRVDDTEFILRSKYKPPVENGIETSYQFQTKNPTRLTSIFTREQESMHTTAALFDEEENQKDEARTDETTNLSLPYFTTQTSINSTEEKAKESPIVYPVKLRSTVQSDYKVREIPKPPETPTPPKTPEIPEPELLVTPDYDNVSILNYELPEQDASVPVDNRFAYADAAILRQNTRFRKKSATADEKTSNDLLSPMTKQVAFNPLSSYAEPSSIQTSNLNLGSYGNIPPAPPLPS